MKISEGVRVKPLLAMIQDRKQTRARKKIFWWNLTPTHFKCIWSTRSFYRRSLSRIDKSLKSTHMSIRHLSKIDCPVARAEFHERNCSRILVRKLHNRTREILSTRAISKTKSLHSENVRKDASAWKFCELKVLTKRFRSDFIIASSWKFFYVSNLLYETRNLQIFR